MSNEVAVQSHGSVAPQHDREFLGLLIQFTVFDEGGLVLNRMPTAAERRALQDRKSDLGRALMPARETGSDTVQLRTALALWIGGYSSLAHVDNGGLVASYVSYLQEKPLWAVMRAIQAAKDGLLEVFDGKGAPLPLSSEFAPSAQSLRDAAAGYVRSYEAERDKIGQVLTARRLMRPEPTPESRERVGAMLTEFAATLSMRDATSPDVEAAAQARRAKHRQWLADRERAAVLGEYARRGIEPVERGGILISPALLDKVAEWRGDDTARRSTDARREQDERRRQGRPMDDEIPF